MLNTDLWIAGTGACLPPRMELAEMLAAGWCDERQAEASGMLAGTIAGEKDSPAAMAAAAARTALEHSGHTAQELSLLLHASVCDQGNDLWPASSHVQRAGAPGSTCPALEVRAASNGGMAGLYLATQFLAASRERPAVLVSAGDVFSLPVVDRWRSDSGTVYTDGGAALVLSRRGGFARLRSIAMVSDPVLEGMHRSGDPFGDALLNRTRRVELDAYKRTYLRHTGTAATLQRIAAGQREALDTALADADTRLGDIARVVVPHFGRRRLETNCLRPLGVDIERTTWEFSRTVGHIGAGDQMAGLDHLVRTGQVGPGDRVLLLGVGSGFSWSAAVLEIGAPQ